MNPLEDINYCDLKVFDGYVKFWIDLNDYPDLDMVTINRGMLVMMAKHPRITAWSTWVEGNFLIIKVVGDMNPDAVSRYM